MPRRAPHPADRAIRELRYAIADIQAEGGTADVVARGRARELIRRLSKVPVAMFVADNRGRYVDVNGAAVKLTGFTRQELLARSVWDLTPRPRRGAGAALWRAFLTRGRMSGWYQLCRKSGRVVRARYFAVANVLPGLHVSALATTALVDRISAEKTRSAARRKRRRVGTVRL